MTAKTRNLLNWAVKLGIIIASAFFIWRRLVEDKNLENFSQIIHHLNKTRLILTLVSVLLLMLLNWTAEAFKWKLQLKGISNISIWTSLQSVFCGLTVGIITPNRIGDYGTRVFFLRPRMRVYGLIAMGTGAIAQFILINIIAGTSICIFLYWFKGADWWVISLVGAAFGILCILLLQLYFNMHMIRQFVSKIKFLSRYDHFFHILSHYKVTVLIQILLICLLRISILIGQYYIIIHLLIPELDFFKVVLMVALLISFQTVLPTIELLDIGVRGATAVYFFSFITRQDVSILATTSVIWLVNLIIPAIIGLGFVYKLKLFGHTDVQQ